MTERAIDAGHALATLLHLGKRAREADSLAELGFVAVNESYALLPYRQAALWLDKDRPATGQLLALSGVASIEGNAPYVMWLSQLFEQARPTDTTPLCALDALDISPELASEWSEWLPHQVLLVRLPSVQQFPGGDLLLAREEAWSQAELSLLPEWGAMLAHAFALHQPTTLLARLRRWQGSWATQARANTEQNLLARLRHWLARRSLWQLGLMAMALLSLLPVRLTVLAPAELVPLKPEVIRAPMDGVVDKVLVTPNQTVKKGTPLFEFDRISVESRLQVAASALATSQAEYRSRAQRALFEVESKAQLAVIQGQIEEKRAEVDYLKSLSGRAAVTAPMDGVVLFGDATEWVGRPVVTGERVMVVADPQAAEVEAWLSPGDAVPLEVGDSVQVYLNADPLRPLQARLRYVAHEAVARPEGHYAYRVRAELLPGEQGRVGLKGSAKLAGQRVLLFYWVLRRPLAQARAWLGW